MGLTKEYARYVPAGNFNIIASENCHIAFVTLQGEEGRFVAVGACENIIIWDVKFQQKALVLCGETTAAVTSICANVNKQNLAGGYTDGNIYIFDLKTAETQVTFSGHRAEVTILAFGHDGYKLASGSKDNEVIVWDILAEVGLCRLSGHKGPITQIVFMMEYPVLITGSKDKFVKFWDLDTQHCFKTLIDHRTEIGGLVLVSGDKYLITACGDAELRIWKLSRRELKTEYEDSINHLTTKLELIDLQETDDVKYPLQCNKVGSLFRIGKGRVVSMVRDGSGQMVACHGTDNQLECFYFCSDKEAHIRMTKRLQKEKMKERSEPENKFLTLKDEVKRLPSIKVSNKPKCISLILGTGGELRVVTNLSNNTIELYSLQSESKEEPRCLRSIVHQGHHSEIRSLAFSSDNLAIISGSAESIKLWNRPSQACVRTIATRRPVLCSIFAPGDRHVLAGLKDGTLLVIDVAGGDIVEEIPAHAGELWSICLHEPKGCVTGSGDKTVKFWQFELVVDGRSENKIRTLSLLHTRTMSLEDCVLCVKVTPNNKFVAVALLDFTVKIFFLDTLKFYLMLYGHQLPVLCMDISFDSSLIATASGDRNIKIWGMDFGDCRKSIFAHEDSITGLQFVNGTHYFFTCGGDGKIKQWDGDSFCRIITLPAHFGEAFTLASSANGRFIVSSGGDHDLRLYEKSDEPVILEDEQEKERELLEGLATGDRVIISGHAGFNLTSKKTVSSETAAENLLECLEVCKMHKEELARHKASSAGPPSSSFPKIPMLMEALGVTTCEDFLLKILKQIKASGLEEAILLLPFTSTCELLSTLPSLIAQRDKIEELCKVAIFSLKLHHGPIMSTSSLRNILSELHKNTSEEVHYLRDVIGKNRSSLKCLAHEMETSKRISLFSDAVTLHKKWTGKTGKRDKIKRSLIALNG